MTQIPSKYIEICACWQRCNRFACERLCESPVHIGQESWALEYLKWMIIIEHRWFAQRNNNKLTIDDLYKINACGQVGHSPLESFWDYISLILYMISISLWQLEISLFFVSVSQNTNQWTSVSKCIIMNRFPVAVDQNEWNNKTDRRDTNALPHHVYLLLNKIVVRAAR